MTFSITTAVSIHTLTSQFLPNHCCESFSSWIVPEQLWQVIPEHRRVGIRSTSGSRVCPKTPQQRFRTPNLSGQWSHRLSHRCLAFFCIGTHAPASVPIGQHPSNPAKKTFPSQGIHHASSIHPASPGHQTRRPLTGPPNPPAPPGKALGLRCAAVAHR